MGSRDRAPGEGLGGPNPLKLKRFCKTTSKSVHKFSTFTTYMQGLVSYFADKKTRVTCWFGGSQSAKSYSVGGVWYANEVEMCKQFSPDQRSVVQKNFIELNFE